MAKIADAADSHLGSSQWSYTSTHRTGANTNKCNIFVAEVIEQAGASLPHRHWFTWSPIGAGEWGNLNSPYLTKDKCWSHVDTPQRGDVAGLGGHVGIVTGAGQTTSATDTAVVKNDWGFRPGQQPVFWRYSCQ